ncbi:MAG: GAF domain-containing sensor histidine kinase, partial [Chloroflexi bacterium]|nr:GAF domain-containing sensor histidine kinase [Chloroflexota bacterium]
LGGLWFAILIVLDANYLSLPEILFTGAGWIIERRLLVEVALVVGWGIFAVETLWLTGKAYCQTQQVVVRKHITLWTFGLILTLGGPILLPVGDKILGEGLNWLGALVITYTVLTPRLPDLRAALRQALSSLTTAILALAIYTLGFIGIQYLFGDVLGFIPLIVGLVLSLVLLLLFNPLLRVIRRLVNRLVFGEGQDSNRILREYSQSISNILDIELLATVAVGLVSEVLGVERGALFLVYSELDDQGEKCFRLKGVKGMGQETPQIGVLPVDSSIVKTFGKDRQPLTRLEIDILPQYRYITGKERNWLLHQDMDIFVPIHAKDEWVGLLALGPNSSGTSYRDEDLELLGTLADQTAVALQNARLVESLVRVNNEFRRAYTAMEEALTKLKRLDRTKSDFISIASHELRTPLTVLTGYSQMLLDDPIFTENTYYKKVIVGINDGTSRLHEIIDSMFEIAKIDTRALELQSNAVDMPALLKQVCQSFAKAFEARRHSLVFDMMSDLPAVQGDPEALKKVFHHIIVNAIKYTPDGGEILVSGYYLPKGNVEFPQGGVKILVSDTGIGIDPRFKELIFVKFYQTGELALHSSGKTKFKGGGPGLGLAIVRGIVQAHGGRVWVESPGYDEETNPGSHFHVILPLHSEST